MNLDKTTAFYIRSAVEDNDAVQQQETLLRTYADKHGYDAVDLYVDNGAGGNALDRPAFNKMNADIESGKIGAVIVRDIARISRDSAKCLDWINSVKSKDVTVISAQDGQVLTETDSKFADFFRN